MSSASDHEMEKQPERNTSSSTVAADDIDNNGIHKEKEMENASSETPQNDAGGEVEYSKGFKLFLTMLTVNLSTMIAALDLVRS